MAAFLVAMLCSQETRESFVAISWPGIVEAADTIYQGFGTTTPGGSGGTIVDVTSLNDSGPGTLREALSKGNNVRVVFKVGGTINLQSQLNVRGRSFITIDGSTAPDPGITLQGYGLYIRNSRDIIITHLRIRDSAFDGITLWDGSSNVVIDHCSVTNSADGNIDITEDTRNVTVSWSIIGDTRPDSFASKSKGMLIANFNKPPVTNVSLHHNLFINEFQRSPQVSTAGLIDIRNNVIRDWGAYGIRIRNGAWGNIINNVFDTNNNPEDAVVLVSDVGPVYIQGNQGPGARDVNSLTTAADAFSVAPVTTDPVTEVEQKVLQGAGAFPRDDVDIFLAPAIPNQPPVAANQPPAVNAGANQTITLPASATLDGTVTDDGLASSPGAVVTTWAKVSGPGTVTFGKASAVDTTASFSQSGIYVLRLTANDGALSASDNVTVTVNPAPAGNQPPAVNAGANQTITLPASASLDGTVTDDGLPNPPSKVTTSWTKISGPGTVSFGNPSAIDTTASFTAAGTYLLRLRASDGALSSSDDVTVTVNPAPTGQAVVSFTLINARTDQPIAAFNPLNSGATLNLATLPTRNLYIRANTSPATVGSVRFGLDGKANYQTENRAPYDAGIPSLGLHTLTATPYTRSNASGTAGSPLTITFSVIDKPN